MFLGGLNAVGGQLTEITGVHPNPPGTDQDSPGSDFAATVIKVGPRKVK